MSSYKLAVAIRNPKIHDEFLAVKHPRPPKFGHEEYDFYVDSDLWDLPSAPLDILQSEEFDVTKIEVDGHEFCSGMLDLRRFRLSLALNKVLEQVGIERLDEGRWRFMKYVEEPDFGPGLPSRTVFITGQFELGDGLKGLLADVLAVKLSMIILNCLWMSKQKCLDWLLEMKQGSDRLGPLVVTGLINESGHSLKCDIPNSLPYQEYPPGVMLVPMGSRTSKPFRTTNLVIISPQIVLSNHSGHNFVAVGDALIVDPGCYSALHAELACIVAALPRKLIVFVTHHHPDHVDGLSIIQKLNPDAILLAHENTMRRIGKGDWSLGYTSVSGDDEIYVGGQQLRAIFAPGHTDGHMALLHMGTQSLVVGDHCVGQGSAVLDVTSGGNMAEYFETTYKFLELSPRVLIPMHGRVNLWPRHMLCGYLKNRRERESSVLKAMANGANTLFNLVSTIYKDVDRRLWIPAASNVRLHVEHLAQQHKLPQDFSLETFKGSISTLAEDTSK